MKHTHVHLHYGRDDAWNEADHPRAPDGKFGASGGGGANGGAGHTGGASGGGTSSAKMPEIPEQNKKVGLSQLALLDGRGTEYRGTGIGTAQKGDVLVSNVLEGAKPPMNYSLADQELPGEPKIEKLNLRNLIGTQVSVDTQQVGRFIRGEINPKELPQVARTPDGKLYLQDGHHRMIALRLSGIRSAEFEVHDVPGPPPQRSE